jgi:hypothetical protein
MSFAPRQNYRLYDAAVSARKLELCLAASESDRFDRYAEYFDAVAEATPVSSSEIREQRLLEKIATREKLAGAFHERDKWIREKRTPNHTD